MVARQPRPLLNPHHREARLEFARWALDNWDHFSNITFSDEKQFCTGAWVRHKAYCLDAEVPAACWPHDHAATGSRPFHAGHPQRGWDRPDVLGRPVQEHAGPPAPSPVPLHGRELRGPRLRLHGTQIAVGRATMPPQVDQWESSLRHSHPELYADGVPRVFQQDGARVHTSHAAIEHLRAFFDVAGWSLVAPVVWPCSLVCTAGMVDMFSQHDPWPAHSPDFNPIEMVWMAMCQALNRRQHAELNAARWKAAIHEAWKEVVTPELWDSCLNRVKLNMQSAVAQNGDNKYKMH